MIVECSAQCGLAEPSSGWPGCLTAAEGSARPHWALHSTIMIWSELVRVFPATSKDVVSPGVTTKSTPTNMRFVTVRMPMDMSKSSDTVVAWKLEFPAEHGGPERSRFENA